MKIKRAMRATEMIHYPNGVFASKMKQKDFDEFFEGLKIF
jgi:hypothetical protein